MSRKTLKALFHMSGSKYKEEYERRFNDEDTIHLPIKIGNEQAFICRTPDIYEQILRIERIDKKVFKLYKQFPRIAIEQYTQNCLIDEIVLTNNIEGVHSTRKEISDILSDLLVKDKRNRFVGLVIKYMALNRNIHIPLKTCQDIRKIYDDIFFDEIKATNPDDLPDGAIFRKSGVEVLSATQKVIHKGLLPEGKIIEAFEQSLAVLNDDDIDIFIRIAVFHYLFGYIHPFYDGNGRTSRFISSYLLSRQLTPLIGYRLSYTIKENISKYYEAFKICNDTHNKGELTPFVEMFLNIVETSMQKLLETLEDKMQRWEYYSHRIDRLPMSDDPDVRYIYDLLIKAALFSNIGISREGLVKHMERTDNTVRKKLKMIPAHLIIENHQKKRKFYLLDLDETDKFFEE